MIYALLIAVALNVINAFVDSIRIKKNIRINHTVTAVVYLVLCIVSAIALHNIWLVIPMLLIRPVVFDMLLNMLRGLNPFHVSMTTTSVIDKWEVRLLGTNGMVHWLVWIGLTVLSVVVINIVK